MSDIYNHLVKNNFSAMDTEELKDLRMNADGAHSAVMAAMSAMGELAFWSADNENYDNRQAREDLRRIGEALMHLPRIAEALNDTEQNAQFEIHHREGFPKW
ncbi:hypothetical protein Xvie_03843 [Xenorhabdus vietnamensis]|uniref:Uncharacterized protein n=1 Tax=Xenorhabdus vietnamensis TaxID=351656 RepID=A0A1Y2S8M1_9GAMM|nr:hypothetical protein [Xenorhabdus vietnamensis]OTA14272.1 hypothetical protein Xvie_03843 [Xenorhabdus vietnamensis]